MPKDRYTPKEAADLLNVSDQTIMLWIHSGKIEFIQLGSRYFIAQSTIESLLTPHAKLES